MNLLVPNHHRMRKIQEHKTLFGYRYPRRIIVDSVEKPRYLQLQNFVQLKLCKFFRFARSLEEGLCYAFSLFYRRYLCCYYHLKKMDDKIAVPDVVEAAKDADILIFVIPHQFINKICSVLAGKIKPTAVGLSLIKGFDKKEGGGIELISHIISKQLRIPVSVLMGANLASEVAEEMFCETTIGCKDKNMAPVLRDLIQTSYFRVVVVEDVDSVECCGALKNIVACGAGFVDGLELGDNTKAAVIRLGLMEMIKFIDVFFPGGKLATFFESCGVADLITTCYGGRNRKVSEAFVKTGKTIQELEKEMLNGQKLQGPFTAEEVNYMLKARNMENRFPLFTAIHRICIGEIKPTELIDCIRNHPEHMDDEVKAPTLQPRCHL